MAKIKFTQVTVQVLSRVIGKIGEPVKWEPFCPLSEPIEGDPLLLPRTNKRSKREDPIIAYAHDPNEKWEAM